MTNPGPMPDGTLGGLGGIAAWGAEKSNDWKNSLGQGMVDRMEGIKLFDGFGKAKNVELAGMQDKTQALEGIIGYAHGYINGGWSGTLGPGKQLVTNPIGRTIGVTRASGAYYLSSKGLWVADAHLSVDPSGLGVGDDVELQVRVYSDTGSLHFIRSNMNAGSQRQTLTVHAPFTIPNAGYYVEFWAAVAIARNVPMGSRWTGLSVEKRSTEED